MEGYFHMQGRLFLCSHYKPIELGEIQCMCLSLVPVLRVYLRRFMHGAVVLIQRLLRKAAAFWRQQRALKTIMDFRHPYQVRNLSGAVSRERNGLVLSLLKTR